MAQAPILSMVSRSGTQRSFWAMVPAAVDGRRGEAHAHAHGGDHAGAVAAQLDDRDERERRVAAALAPGPLGRGLALGHGLGHGPLELDLALEAVPGHLVHAEGREQLAQDVVGRRVAVLELVEVGLDLRLDEPAHGVAQHQLLVTPSVHGLLLRFGARVALDDGRVASPRLSPPPT